MLNIINNIKIYQKEVKNYFNNPQISLIKILKIPNNFNKQSSLINNNNKILFSKQHNLRKPIFLYKTKKNKFKLSVIKFNKNINQSEKKINKFRINYNYFKNNKTYK